jgi:oxygen-dependent protoporphyrinogen oxidase
VGQVAVVGGGVAGMVAARELAIRGHQVRLFEGSPVLGGKLRGGSVVGARVDLGAEAFLVRVPAAVELAGALGLAVVHPVTSSAGVVVNGRIVALPPRSVLGVPTSPRGLRAVVGSPGMLRAALDLVLPATALPEDPSVADLVGARLGSRVLERLVEPLLGGVYAGRAADLSVAATAPQLATAGRSLLRGVRGSRSGATGPVFGAVPGGLAALIDALAADLDAKGVAVETDRPARTLSARGADWVVDRLRLDAVVLALPAAPAARLLAAVVPDAVLPDTAYASVAVVTMALSGPPAVRGSGFLVPGRERRVIKGVTLLSQKWGRPPEEPVLVRASIGRFGDERVLQRDDVELAGVAAAEVAEITGWSGRVLDSVVTRWGGGLPQYRPGHLERVRQLRAALPPTLAVAGAAVDGVGVPACIRSGQAAAAQLHAALSGS